MRGDSGFLTPEFAAQIEAARQENVCVTHPAVKIDGHLVHVYEDGGEWDVWLNCEDMEFTGLCIGTGATRDRATAQAVAALEAVITHLQKG